MKRVFICSPYRGNVDLHVRIAEQWIRRAILEGCAPFAPHLLYPRSLDDSNARERTLGITAGIEFLKVCDELWAIGTPTAGMQQEIAYATDNHIPVVYFPRFDIDTSTMLGSEKSHS